LPTKYFDIHNVVLSNPPSKDMNEWEQGTEETEYTIKPLPVRDQIILDPFMGSGTTGEGALNLERRFIGIEIEKIYCSNAAQRLSKFIRDTFI
jgi:hypothetical protein